MAADGNVPGDCITNFALLNQTPTFSGVSKPPLAPFFLTRSSSPSFFGRRSIFRFEDADNQVRSFQLNENGDDDDKYDDLDEYFRQPEKKRRLSADQVKFLEKSFEVENKLEPERKTQLAKDLCLQPRQVAIWFQNRRARWKTKQLEQDYQTLESSYDTLKADCDCLVKKNDQLKAEINLLTDKLQMKKEHVDTECEKVMIICEEPLQKPCAGAAIDSGSEGITSGVVSCKQQDDMSSARSDVFDSDSPHGVHSSLLDESDHSQDKEDNLSKSLLPESYLFPKLEDDDYSDPSANFENHSFWSSWPY